VHYYGIAVLLVTLFSAPTKRKDSPYRSGRSPDWLKMKNPAAPAVKRTFYDASGNFVGSSVTIGGSTSFYGRDGAFQGTLSRTEDTTNFMTALAAIRVR
jgi:hypothetical protein